MLKQEFELSDKQNELTPEVSMITNLQSMKHCLLADYDDDKIFSDVLLKLDFTDTLIQQHLSGTKGEKK